jgi:hypothetical protein
VGERSGGLWRHGWFLISRDGRDLVWMFVKMGVFSTWILSVVWKWMRNVVCIVCFVGG